MRSMLRGVVLRLAHWPRGASGGMATLGVPSGDLPDRALRGLGRFSDMDGGKLMKEPIAELKGVVKSYRMDQVDVPVLKGVDLLIQQGHFTVLYGPSGSGKTTLLNLIGCLDKQDDGTVKVAGRDVSAMGDDELADFRCANIGFVFQSFSLIPVLTAFENIEYPLILAGMDKERRRRRVRRLLDHVGLGEHGAKMPGQLSGGQRQRVAIARALVGKPKLVIADEPTANLDSTAGGALIELLQFMQREFKMTFVFSTHDPSLGRVADDLIVVKDGKIQIKRLKATAPAAEAVDSEDPGSAADSQSGSLATAGEVRA